MSRRADRDRQLRAESATDSAERALLRLRPEIKFTPIRRGLQTIWRARHALTLDHFEVTDDEWFILSQLDGRTSDAEVCRRYEQAFRPRRLTAEALRRFLKEAFEAGVIDSTAAGQATIRASRRKQALRQKLALAPFALLGLRVPLLDPTWLLAAGRPLSRLLFGKWFGWLGAVVGIVTLILLCGRFGAVSAQFPATDSLLTIASAGQLLGLWLAIKLAHELGHAFACDRFGGECHEMGVMFVGLAPVFYCDVTDAWSFKSRWCRAAVSAGGVYVELLIAIAAGLLWLTIAPGPLSELLIKVLVICSLNTIVFNLNPLLKLDGYYLLGDLFETSNLHERSRRVLWGSLTRWLTCGKVSPAWGESNQVLLASFAIASYLYQAMVSFVIVWIVWRFFDGLGVPLLGVLFGILFLAAAGLGAVRFLTQLATSTQLRQAFSSLRTAVLVALLATILMLAATWPFPRTAPATAMIMPRDSVRLFSQGPGRVTGLVDYGAQVDAGQVLATINEPELKLRETEFAGRLIQIQAERAVLRTRVVSDPDLAAQAKSLAAIELAIREQLRSLREELEHQVIRAPAAGVFLPPPLRKVPAIEGELPDWNGLPLAAVNEGCYLEAGTELGAIAGGPDHKILLAVAQEDIPEVAIGSQVRLRLDQIPQRTLIAKVKQIGRDRIGNLPESMGVQGAIATKPMADGFSQPIRPMYFIEAELEGGPYGLSARSGGWAKIELSNQPLWRRCWRYLRQLWLLSG